MDCRHEYQIKPSDVGQRTMFFASGEEDDCFHGVRVAVTATSCPSTTVVKPVAGMGMSPLINDDLTMMVDANKPANITTAPLGTLGDEVKAEPEGNAAGAMGVTAVIGLVSLAVTLLLLPL